MTFKGLDLTPLLQVLISTVVPIVAGLLLRAQNKIAAANAQDAAWKRLAGIGLAIAGDLWHSLSTEFQTMIADGKIDEAERAAIKKMVEQKLEQYTSRGEIEKIAVALGLPLPAVIAWVAEYLIDRLTKAHDPMTPDVAEGAYPVRAAPAPAATIGTPNVDETLAANPNAYVG